MVNEIEKTKQKIIPILKHHKVKRAGLFGSSARNAMKPDSDVDILVEITDDISLLDSVGIKLEVEEAIGRKVDLVEYATIKPLLRDSILDGELFIL